MKILNNFSGFYHWVMATYLGNETERVPLQIYLIKYVPFLYSRQFDSEPDSIYQKKNSDLNILFYLKFFYLHGKLQGRVI